MKRLLKWLGGGWLAWRLFGPETKPKLEVPQEHPLRLPGRTVFHGEHEFFVRETGPVDAPVLLLIHGWGDHGVVVFHRMIPDFAAHYRVVTIDNRNTSKTDRIRSKFTVADAADDIAGVLGVLGIAEVDAFGYSMGGMIAQELVRRHPGVVRRLILSGTAASAPRKDTLEARIIHGLSLVARAFERVSRSEFSYARTKYLVAMGAVAPEHEEWAWTQHMNRDPDMYWNAGLAIAHYDARDSARKLDLPTLVVITTHDQLMPPDAQYELASLLPDPQVVELIDARHEAPLTHWDRYVKEVMAFLGKSAD